MKVVHIIFYTGPEWNAPVKAYTDKRKADAEVQRMNANPKEKTGRLFPSLSQFVVQYNIPVEVS